jgi:NTP pyrophosphatase (non-canonical NTP hydrolase)
MGIQMNFETYQADVHDLAIYPRGNGCGLLYVTLGLNGEAGEVAENVKKMLRDDGGNLTDERHEALVNELGDVLWYVSELSTVLGVNLAEVATKNITKLRDRRERNVIRGEGDTR